eukprot:TRINITY_DN25170_c0_g1_i3.p1 TRINITY_DN25170_c0_g1~~TRINITY_DN25170_c0_g1_i3.p1  ORF type:complete len:527 (+),score=100.14 TRINITY_DN25170_c0_g1_i3:69-1649(+)
MLPPFTLFSPIDGELITQQSQRAALRRLRQDDASPKWIALESPRSPKWPAVKAAFDKAYAAVALEAKEAERQLSPLASWTRHAKLPLKTRPSGFKLELDTLTSRGQPRALAGPASRLPPLPDSRFALAPHTAREPRSTTSSKWHSETSHMEEACSDWPTFTFDPASQVFRTQIEEGYHYEEWVHKQQGLVRKAKLVERSAECREQARRYRRRREHKQRGGRSHWEGASASEIQEEQHHHGHAMRRLSFDPALEEMQDSPEEGSQDTESCRMGSRPSRLSRFQDRVNTQRKAAIRQSMLLSEATTDVMSEDVQEGVVERNGRPTSTAGSTTTGAFDLCMLLARKHNIPLAEVRKQLEEFRELDVDDSGQLSKEEFEAALRKRCIIDPDHPLPDHLMIRQWAIIDTDNSGMVDFEEFLLWSLGAMWKEELLVSDLGERRLRQLARAHNLQVNDIEFLQRLFNRFDEDRSNSIEKDEFKNAIVELKCVKDPEHVSQKLLDRYWTEADVNQDGSLSFEEFVAWYLSRCSI